MLSKSAPTVQAIDVHGHYGTYNINPGDCHPLRAKWYCGSAKEVAQRGKDNNTEYTVVSPLLGLMPRGHNHAVAGNNYAWRIVPKTPGLLQWVIIDPQKPETYQQAERMFQSPYCVGVKIHPEEHCYSIRTHGRTLFEFFAKHKCLVLTHTSERNSLCDHFVPFLNDFPQVKVILAHIGCGYDGDPTHQVRAIQKAKHGNAWADTSSSNSITPNLIEWAVKEVGPDRVLYGTDTPLYCASMQRARIDQAEMSDKAKRMVLRDNAYALLGLKEREARMKRGKK